MKTKPKLKDVLTPELCSLVSTYLVTRAFAETMREKVDEVYREVLTQYPVYANTFDRTEQILSSGKLYMCSDEALVRVVYDEVNKRLLARKLKPADMEADYCPALVAENLQTTAENLLIESAGAPFGITNSRLMCSGKGLENRQKFIDLNVQLVVSSTGFKNPLTQKEVRA